MKQVKSASVKVGEKKCAQMVWFSLVIFFSDHIGTVKEISCFLDTLLGTRKHIPNQPTLLSRWWIFPRYPNRQDIFSRSLEGSGEKDPRWLFFRNLKVGKTSAWSDCYTESMGGFTRPGMLVPNLYLTMTMSLLIQDAVALMTPKLWYLHASRTFAGPHKHDTRTGDDEVLRCIVPSRSLKKDSKRPRPTWRTGNRRQHDELQTALLRRIAKV